MTTLMPVAKQQFFDDNGNFLSGGKLYSYAAGTATPLATYNASDAANANPVILNARGEADVRLGPNNYKFILKNASDVQIWSVDNVPSSGSLTIYPTDPRFGAVGDGVADDSTEIQAAIEYAGDVATAQGAGAVVIDLLGKTYGIAAPLVLLNMRNVWITNGTLKAISGFPAGRYVVEIGNGAGASIDTANNGIERVGIECNYLANGIQIYQADYNVIRDVTTIHFASGGYGVRVRYQCTETLLSHVRSSRFWYGDSGFDDYLQRTGTAISVEGSDVLLDSCIAYYCKYPLYVDNTFGFSCLHSHFYNGAATVPTFSITAVANNGSGLVRITTPSTSGFATGDLVIVPWLPGVDGPTAGGSAVGVRAVTVIDATTLDLQGSVFAGAYTGSGQYFTDYDFDPYAVYITANNSNLNFSNTQFDNGKVTTRTPKISIVGCFWSHGAPGQNRLNFEMVVTTASDALSGLGFVGNRLSDNVFQKFTIRAEGAGSLASSLVCMVFGNWCTDGLTAPAYGKVSLGAGTKSAPSLQFTQTDEAISDWSAGAYAPAVHQFAFVSQGKHVIFGQKDKVTFGDSSSATAQLVLLDGQAGQNRYCGLLSSGLTRWQWGGTNTAESGANAGTDFAINAYADAGTFIASDITINRASGLVTVGANTRSGTRVRINTDSATTVGAAGGASALPATPTGYLTVNINGTDRKIPYYAT